MSTVAVPPACPHEIRPGTTVCLHCAAAERRAARAHTRRVVSRAAVAMGAVTAVAAFAAVGRSGVAQLRAARAQSAVPSATALVAADSAAEAGVAVPVAVAPVAAPDDVRAPAPNPTPAPLAAAPAPPSAPTPARLTPRLAVGRTPLGGGVVAERRGDTVTVLFDTPDARTRHADKFEHTVRHTLPAVYGPVADSALAGVPAGTLVGARGLLASVERGLRLPLAAGGALALRPATRPGRDGPLVVAYAVVPTP